METPQLKPLSEVIKDNVFESAIDRANTMYNGRPSVTTILKLLPDSKSFKAFKAYSKTRFDSMMKAAGERGTLMHKHIETSYLKSSFTAPPIPWADSRLDFYTKEGSTWKPLGLETKLIMDDVAGTVDAIMDIDGVTTIVDRKTYGARMYPELLFKYKLQLSKYADMYTKKTGTTIDSGAIVGFPKKGKYKIITITKDEMAEYLDIYNYILETFNDYYDKYRELSGIQEGFNRDSTVQEGNQDGQGLTDDNNNDTSNSNTKHD